MRVLCALLVLVAAQAIEVSVGDLIKIYELGKDGSGQHHCKGMDEKQCSVHVADCVSKFHGEEFFTCSMRKGFEAMVGNVMRGRSEEAMVGALITEECVDQDWFIESMYETYNPDYFGEEDAQFKKTGVHTCEDYAQLSYDYCASESASAWKICPSTCPGGCQKLMARKAEYDRLTCKETSWERCHPSNANEWMCDPVNNNDKKSGNFLTECPASCYLAGFDHGQCEVIEAESQQCVWETLDDVCLTDEGTIMQGASQYTSGHTWESCGTLCLETFGCNGYTFHTGTNAAGGRCWLKAGASGFDTACGLSYRKSSFKACESCHWVGAQEGCLDAEQLGDRLDNVETQEACFDHCKSTAGCQGYTYHTNLGRCWLKSEARGFDAECSENYRISDMILCSACVPRWTEERDGCLTTATENNSMLQNGAKFSVVEHGICYALCAQSSECNGYVHHSENNRCWLKSDATGYEQPCTAGEHRSAAFEVCS